MRKWDFKIDKSWDRNPMMSPSEELERATHLVIWKDYYQCISWCQGDLTSWSNSIPQVWDHKNLEGAIRSFSYHNLSLIRHSSGRSRCKWTSSRTHCLVGGKECKQIIWKQGDNLHKRWVRKSWYSEQLGRQEALGFIGSTLGIGQQEQSNTCFHNISRYSLCPVSSVFFLQNHSYSGQQ